MSKMFEPTKSDFTYFVSYENTSINGTRKPVTITFLAVKKIEKQFFRNKQKFIDEKKIHFSEKYVALAHGFLSWRFNSSLR